GTPMLVLFGSNLGSSESFARDSIVGYFLAGEATPGDFDHVPAGDVVDETTGSQYFFHRHADDPHDPYGDEIGHFHCFVRAPVQHRDGTVDFEPPTRAIGHCVAGHTDGHGGHGLSHLVAISIDALGLPCRLFTTNRWVTGETWRPAKSMVPLIDDFAITHGQPNFIVNQWLTEMIRLFRPQIIGLLEQRDLRLAGISDAPLATHLTDHQVEIVTTCDITVPDHIAAITAALALCDD
ncbi:MAG: hypothetical protein AAF213_11660, partial [Pseudomonadota bacterium]